MLRASPEPELETVMVYARRITPVSRVAATVTVIDQARIQATLASDIRELVRYEPGLSVRSDPFRFGLDTISVRGLGGNRVAVEIDGIPAAGGFAVGSYADSGRAFLDPAFVDRVEILRGPASALYGSDAIGGVVAMSTITPARMLAPSGEPLALRTEAGYDTGNDGWRAAVLAAGEAGSMQWLLGYARHEAHEADTAAAVDPDPADVTSDAVLVQLQTAAPGGPLSFTFDASRLQQDTDVNAFLGVGRFLNTTLLQGDDSMLRYRASVQQKIATQVAAFDTANWSLYWQGTGTDQDTCEVRKAVPPRSPPVRLDRAFEFDESTLGLEFTAAKDLGSGAVAHDVVYGLEATRSQIDELRDGLQTDLRTGATTPTILGETFPLRDLPRSTVDEVGAFVQDEIRWTETRWSVIPALRIDYYRLTPDVDGIYRADNPSTQPVGVDELSMAPKLGVLYSVSPRLGLFFQYAHGFRSPPPEDVNIGLEIPLFNVRAIPNPDLRPESSDGFELGLRLTGTPWSMTASVFQTEYDDFIESKVNLGVDPATGVTLFQSQNVADARIYGAEADVRLDAEALSPRLAGWTGRLAASWARGDDLQRDQPLNSIDPPRAVLAVRYDAPASNWGTELALTAVEAQRRVDRSRADLYRTDGYATLDWLLQWNVAPRLRLNAGVFNLADASYIEWADVRGRIAADPLIPYYTRAGRNASVSLTYQF
ncbi:MAG: TonB-dependent hemoglobin/transferrin/lactoferrin family receptor [Gammaproteobacteria bacterium]|nr:TonB-dependent hemoglobin/transferrin/lactoferrin family receptor [Gammaproteobacteria bacterium]